MKYLLILLFLFSTHSFSGELDGKGIDCVVTNNSIIKKNKRKQMWWFNNGLVSPISVSYEAKDSSLVITKIPGYNLINERELRKVPLNLFEFIDEYYVDADYIYWRSMFVDYKLNRKNLKIKTDNMKGTCRVFVGFEEVEKRQEELLQKAKDKYNKAREGNKI